MSQGSDEVGRGRSQDQRSHQPTQYHAFLPRYPTDDQLHSQRVDAREKYPGQEAKTDRAGRPLTRPGKGGIGGRGEHCRPRENTTGTKSVGEACQRDRHGSNDESQLHGGQKHPATGKGQRPFGRHLSSCRVAAEPRRRSQKLRQHQQRHDPSHANGISTRRVSRSAIAHTARVMRFPQPRDGLTTTGQRPDNDATTTHRRILPGSLRGERGLVH